MDCEQLAAHLIRVRDSRVKYIIWNHQICNSSDWTWRRYTGSNPHTKHMHVSIKSTTEAENDTSDWWDLGAGSTSNGAATVGSLAALLARILASPELAAVEAALAALLQPPTAAPTTPPPNGGASTNGSVPPPGHNKPVPPGYRPIKPPPPKPVVAKAVQLMHSKYPIGTQLPVTIDGKDYLFAVEWHKHKATDPVPEGLKRWHRGVTVYAQNGN